MVQAASEQNSRAFVLMPFEPEFESIYTDLIAHALESVGYDVAKADSFADQRNILKDIIRGISRANLVVADVTSLNPNVMYELGIAHALSKPTIMLTQNMDEIPFDLRSYRIIVYSTRFNEVTHLQEKLQKIAKKHEDGLVTFENPVSDFAMKIIEAQPTAKSPQQSNQSPEARVGLDEEEPGILDFLVEADRAMQEITQQFSAITEVTNIVSQKITARAGELELLQKRGTPGSTTRLHTTAREISSDLTEYAQQMERRLSNFHRSWEGLEKNTMGVLSVLAINTPEDRKALSDLKKQTEDFQDTIAQVISGTRTGKKSIESMRGISKDLNRAVKRTARSLDNLIDELITGESYLARIVNLIDERLNEPPAEG